MIGRPAFCSACHAAGSRAKPNLVVDGRVRPCMFRGVPILKAWVTCQAVSGGGPCGWTWWTRDRALVARAAKVGAMKRMRLGRAGRPWTPNAKGTGWKPAGRPLKWPRKP